MYRSFSCIRIRLMPMRLTGNRCQKLVRVFDASGMHWYSLLNISGLSFRQHTVFSCRFMVPVFWYWFSAPIMVSVSWALVKPLHFTTKITKTTSASRS